MESSKLNRTIEEELEEFCAGCNRDDLCIRYRWVYNENNLITGKKAFLTCENLDKCTRLYQYLKERQNG